MATDTNLSRIADLEDEVADLEEQVDYLEEELAELEGYRINIDAALSSYRSGRIVAMLDDLEKSLPSDFIGFADDLIKWAGKTR